MKDKLERITHISAAFDKRDPDPKKNYGIHGCELRMVLKGGRGAVQFLIYTNWQLPNVQKEMIEKHPRTADAELFFAPMAADVGYHSLKPQYEGQKSIIESCEYLNGKPCYYDGSGLRAEEWFKILVEKGSDVIWEMMEEEYHDLFG